MDQDRVYVDGDEVVISDLYPDIHSQCRRIVDAACTIGLEQSRSELLYMVCLVRRLAPKVIVEIGVLNGGTLYAWSMAASAAGVSPTVIGIDLGIYPYNRDHLAYRQQIEHLLKCNGIHDVHMLVADSHQDVTRDIVKDILSGRSVDYLYIDGDHTYSGVKCDFDMYSPLVSSGGIIGLHDIVKLDPSCDFDVSLLWHELMGSYRAIAVTSDYPSHWLSAGNGVIFW